MQYEVSFPDPPSVSKTQPDSIHSRILSAHFSEVTFYAGLGGSIQKIAAALFCHRNTISYRIRVLKEDFGYDLDNSRVCFELTAAFQILEYLQIPKA